MMCFGNANGIQVVPRRELSNAIIKSDFRLVGVEILSFSFPICVIYPAEKYHAIIYLTVIYLTLSVATVLLQTVPIFITIFAPFMTSAKVGLRRFLAVIIGFTGVIILINPNLDGSFAYSVIGLLFGAGATIFGALMFITLRMLGSKDAPVPTAIWYNFIGAIVFGFLTSFTNGVSSLEIIVNEGFWLLLAFIGVSASFQQYLMAKSHQLAPVTVLAPVHYSAIPLSMFVGVSR